MTTTAPEPTTTAPDGPQASAEPQASTTPSARRPRRSWRTWTPRSEPRRELPRRSPEPPPSSAPPATVERSSRLARLLLWGGVFTALLGPTMVAGIVTTTFGTAGQLIAAAPELLPSLIEGWTGYEPPANPQR